LSFNREQILHAIVVKLPTLSRHIYTQINRNFSVESRPHEEKRNFQAPATALYSYQLYHMPVHGHIGTGHQSRIYCWESRILLMVLHLYTELWTVSITLLSNITQNSLSACCFIASFSHV